VNLFSFTISPPPSQALFSNGVLWPTLFLLVLRQFVNLNLVPFCEYRSLFLSQDTIAFMSFSEFPMFLEENVNFFFGQIFDFFDDQGTTLPQGFLRLSELFYSLRPILFPRNLSSLAKDHVYFFEAYENFCGEGLPPLFGGGVGGVFVPVLFPGHKTCSSRSCALAEIPHRKESRGKKRAIFLGQPPSSPFFLVVLFLQTVSFLFPAGFFFPVVKRRLVVFSSGLGPLFPLVRRLRP